MTTTMAIKVDVDTDRGTRLGVPKLLSLFSELELPATFLFSLGPDNTGRAIKRVFRPGFLKKVKRSGVVSAYGLRTLLNGVLLPGPHIGKRNFKIMQQAYEAGHEVGIHCYDHIRWQDGLAKMSADQVRAELDKAQQEFIRIFGFPARTAGAAGWQANALSLSAYDEARLMYGSDVRGKQPFFPRVGSQTFTTLQIPTTLPTLDELLGRPGYSLAKLVDYYLSQLQQGQMNVLTIHAELEGMKYRPWFKELLERFKAEGLHFVRLEDYARDLLMDRSKIPVCELIQGTVEGRSGTMAVQEQRA